MRESADRTTTLFPYLLIVVGVIWLLGNLGVVLPIHSVSILQLWPLFLIVIGLELIFGVRYKRASLWIGLGAIGLVILVLWIGPGLGIRQPPIKETSVFQVPIENAVAAEINLKLSIPKTEINSLTNSGQLFIARVDHIWSMAFSSKGESNKVISLKRDEYFLDWFTWMSLGDEFVWEIGLNPRIPLKLNIDSGIGAAKLNLRDIRLRELFLDVGVGSTSLILPKSIEKYIARIKGGIGNVEIDLPCSNAEIRMGLGEGKILVNLSNGCGLRVEVQEAGEGEVELPAGLIQVRKGVNDREGIWENANYLTSFEKLLLIVENGGPGGVAIR